MAVKPKTKTHRMQSVKPLEAQLQKRMDAIQKLIDDLESGAVGTKSPAGLGSPLAKALRLRAKLEWAKKTVHSCCSDTTFGATFKIKTLNIKSLRKRTLKKRK